MPSPNAAVTRAPLVPGAAALRLALLSAVLGAGFAHPSVRPHLTSALVDAWLAVGVFVAATFLIVVIVERRTHRSALRLFARHPRYEIPIAAFLGALPGCGPTIIVATRFAAGQTSFGALVAAMAATMGDAAFLVLARAPPVGLLLIGMGFVVGCLSGWIVDAIHDKDFLRGHAADPAAEPAPLAPAPRLFWWLWAIVFVPGLLVGSIALFDLTLPDDLTVPIGLAGAILSLSIWAISPSQAATLSRDTARLPLVETVARNTNYVLFWVVIGFLSYELAVGLLGFDVKDAFATVQYLLPLMGVIVGFIPGCGPQIVVSTLYLNGAVPFSVQAGNAISNDGDALFPAIAATPRAAILATLYTAVPSLIVGYGIYLFLE